MRIRARCRIGSVGFLGTIKAGKLVVYPLLNVEKRKKGEDEIEILTFLALPKRKCGLCCEKVEKCEFGRKERDRGRDLFITFEVVHIHLWPL